MRNDSISVRGRVLPSALSMGEPQFLAAVHPIEAAPSHPRRVPQSWGPAWRPPLLSCAAPQGWSHPLPRAGLSHVLWQENRFHYLDRSSDHTRILAPEELSQETFRDGPGSYNSPADRFCSCGSTLVWLLVVPLCLRQREGGLGVL